MKLVISIFTLLLLLSCSNEDVSDNELNIAIERSADVQEMTTNKTASGSSMIYPNPFYDFTHIVLADTTAIVNITNKNGHKSFTSGNTVMLDFSDVAPGCYNCEIIYSNRVERHYLYKLE